MRRTLTFALVGLALACGSQEKTAAPAPAPTPAPAPSAAPAPAPAPAAAARAADPARGEATYLKLCASCHGPHGAGDGPAGQALNPKPAHHNDGNLMNPLTNEFLARVIKEGGAAVGKSPAMAPWGGVLSDDDIRDVIAYIRTLAEPKYTGPPP